MIQNGLDGEREKRAPLTVEHKGTLLTITNTGTRIPRSAMCLGLSTKREDEELIGEHGEGMKVGALAGMRAGYKITIWTADELWTPSLQYYEGYQTVTFGFVVTPSKRSGDSDKVEVRISGVTAEDWLAWQGRFLNLPGGPRVTRMACESGELLTDAAYAGRIYVKGVFVTERPGMSYGYNFRRVKLDCDRQFIESSDLYSAAAEIFNGVGMQDKGWARRMYLLLSENTLAGEQQENGEGQGMANHVWKLSTELKTEVAKEFVDRNGESAVAVADESEADDARSAGLKPVIVTKTLRNLVTRVHGTARMQKERMSKEVKRTYTDADLSNAERSHLATALQTIGRAVTDICGNNVEVVDFRLAGSECLCSAAHEQVKYLRVARSALAEPAHLVVAIAKVLAPQRQGLLEYLLEEALRKVGGAAGAAPQVRAVAPTPVDQVDSGADEADSADEADDADEAEVEAHHAAQWLRQNPPAPSPPVQPVTHSEPAQPPPTPAPAPRCLYPCPNKPTTKAMVGTALRDVCESCKRKVDGRRKGDGNAPRQPDEAALPL